MKQILPVHFLIYCLLSLTGLTCFGFDSYTIQIAASKTQTDIKWFSKRFHIHQEIVEFQENEWYKYVIGEFESKETASTYIALNLINKGLQAPFPRLLPDSLKKLTGKEIQKLITVPPDKSVTVVETTAELISIEKTGNNQRVTMERAKEPDVDMKRPSDKFTRWESLISREKLQWLEMALIKSGKSILPRSSVPFYIGLVDKAFSIPAILFFLMLIGLFALNALGIIIILELSNTLKNQFDRYNELYQAMYERALTGYLFQEFDIEAAVQRMKSIGRPRNRKIFVSVLFNFQKNLSGDSDQKILDIFSRLGLHEDAVRKTKSLSFYQQIIGVRELTNLYPLGAFQIINTHINDNSNELRAEAQTAYVRLNHDEPFRFLRDLRKPFTVWTQLTAFYIFKQHKLQAPQFAEFLQSDLYNVQNFSLQMITHFQQKENAEEIIKLLDSTRKSTRFLVIKAISDLGIHEAKPLLKVRFEKETYRNQLEIVKALLHIGDFDDFDFLERIIRGSDVTLKIEACRSMYFMNSSGMENLLRLELEKELNIEPYIAHIYDPRN